LIPNLGDSGHDPIGFGFWDNLSTRPFLPYLRPFGFARL
jgi:hypothetical protein